MKTLISSIVCCVGLLFVLNVQAAHQVNVSLRPCQAKRLYNSLTGSQVQNDGAAGHLYRKGKDVVCRYTDVDMTDAHGQAIPMHDAKRYVCIIQFDRNGTASPGQHF